MPAAWCLAVQRAVQQAVRLIPSDRPPLPAGSWGSPWIQATARAKVDATRRKHLTLVHLTLVHLIPEHLQLWCSHSALASPSPAASAAAILAAFQRFSRDSSCHDEVGVIWTATRRKRGPRGKSSEGV